MTRYITLEEAKRLPFWRRPVALLFLMALAMPIAFNTWSALLNNFVIEVADFDGSDIGLLHTVREIPGFLAVGVIALIMFIREQVLGIIALALLGAATAAPPSPAAAAAGASSNVVIAWMSSSATSFARRIGSIAGLACSSSSRSVSSALRRTTTESLNSRRRR